MPNQYQSGGVVTASETIMRERIERDYTYHSPTDDVVPAYQEIRATAKRLAHRLVDLVPQGRELSKALTKLEEVVMDANAGIARAGHLARPYIETQPVDTAANRVAQEVLDEA